MPFFYTSGEEIKTGDSVLLHGEAGYVELLPTQSLILMIGWLKKKEAE